MLRSWDHSDLDTIWFFWSLSLFHSSRSRSREVLWAGLEVPNRSLAPNCSVSEDLVGLCLGLDLTLHGLNLTMSYGLINISVIASLFLCKISDNFCILSLIWYMLFINDRSGGDTTNCNCDPTGVKSLRNPCNTTSGACRCRRTRLHSAYHFNTACVSYEFTIHNYFAYV